MKRMIAVSFLIIIMLFSACEKKSSDALTLVTNILDSHPELPAGNVIYHEGAVQGERAYMTQRLCSLLYDDGRNREIPEFQNVLSYAVNLSDGQYGMEIHAFYMKSEADARNMKKLLLRRTKLLKRRCLYLFDSMAYENYFSTAMVALEGRYVFLLATGENEKILSELQRMM